MSEPQVNVPGADDEAALDRELAESIAKVQAGQTVAPQAQSQTGDPAPTGPAGETAPKGAAAPTGETGSTGDATGGSQPADATGEDEFRIPNKGKWETDEAYEKRVELFDLVKRRRAATTPEAKAALSAEITKAKSDLKTLGGTERFTQPKGEGATTGATGATGAVDPNLAADRARLKELGGATQEEVAEIIRQERLAQEVQSDLKKFVDAQPQLKDPDVREVFFDFVDANYVWQNKSGKELTAILGMAYENMFRPSETVTDRVLKAAGVAEKVGAMQFPGGTGGQTTFSPEMKASIDELKATGMSEERAIELLSE